MDSTMRQDVLEPSQVQNDHQRSLGKEHESPQMKNNTTPHAKKTPTATEPKAGALGDITNAVARTSGVKTGRTGQRKERVTKLAEALSAKAMDDMAKLRNEQEPARRVRMQEGRKPAYHVDDMDQVEEGDDKQKRQKKEEPWGKAGKDKNTRNLEDP